MIVKYWRIYITANNGNSSTSIQEIEFRASVGGSDLTNSVGGVASANSEVNTSNTAAKAFDETWEKWTTSTVAFPHWIKYEFNEPVEIKEVSMRCAWSGQASMAPKNFLIQCSPDNSTWHTVREVTNQTGWGVYEERLFEVIVKETGSSWRINISEPDSGGVNLALAELEWRTSVGGPDITGSAIELTSASYNNGTYPKENAFDNNPSTSWWTDSKPHWLAYHFDGNTPVTEVAITTRTDWSWDAPKNFTIEYYDFENLLWVTVLTVTGETGWTSGETRTFSFSNPVSHVSVPITLSETLAATNFKALALNLKTLKVAESSVSGTNPSISAFEGYNLVTLLPDIGNEWKASTAYALNDKVFPTDPSTTPYYYECTTAGTSGATEPTWPLSGAVNDGTVVWTFVEQMVQPITHGPLLVT